MSSEHKDQTQADGIHSAISLLFVDEATRVVFGTTAPEDLYKQAVQTNDQSIWLLIGLGTPVAWVQITAGINAATIAFDAVKGSPGTLNPGQAVYVTGIAGALVTVELSQANNPATMPSVGVVQTEVTDVVPGRVMNTGTVTGLDTSGLTNLDRFYVSDSVAGGLTDTPPPGPAIVQELGVVSFSAAAPDGTLYVNPHQSRFLNDSAGLMANLGIASPGVAVTAARADHVHAAVLDEDLDADDNSIDRLKAVGFDSMVDNLTTVADTDIVWDDGNMQKVTLGGDHTLNFVNPTTPRRLTLLIFQDGVGGRLPAFTASSGLVYSIAGEIELDETALAFTLLGLVFDGSSYEVFEATLFLPLTTVNLVS